MLAARLLFLGCLCVGLISVCHAAPEVASSVPANNIYYSNYSRVPAEALPQLLRRVSNKPEHRDAIRSAVTKGFGRATLCAGSIDYVPQRMVHLYAAVTPNHPLIFDKDDTLVEGIVSERGTASGCGKTLIVNIHTFRRAGFLVSAFGIPGTTHAAPALTTETFVKLAEALQRQISDCRQVRYKQADFVEFVGGPNPKAAIQLDAGGPGEKTTPLIFVGGSRSSL